MKYFKTKGVAIAVMVAAILLSAVFGISRRPAVDIPDGGEALDESLSTLFFEQYVVDEGEVLSAKTEKSLSLYNANWDELAGSIMAVVTVESTYSEAEDLAWTWAEKLQLGQNDAILLMNTLNGEYSVVASGQFYDRISSQGASFVDTALYEYVEDGDYDQAALSLFGGIHLLYGSGEMVQETESSGGVGLLGVIILLLVLLVAFSLVDDILFSRWYGRYGTVRVPAVPYRPILWWHRPGTSWYKQRRSLGGKKPGGKSGGMRPPMGGVRPPKTGSGSSKRPGGTFSSGGSRGGSFGGGSRGGSFGGRR